ncbi:type VI secretion system protein IglI family protein [Nannocystaceae bacterium ST9]
MSERLPSPAELLRGRAKSPLGIDTQANGVVHQLMDLADRGDYLPAASQAAELLRGDTNDVRLVAIYLMGSFVERGAAALPDVLAHVDLLLGEAGSSRSIDSAMAWLFRALTDKIAFHTKQRDEVWNAWLREVGAQHVDEIRARCETILAKAPSGAGTLAKLARWASEKLGPAAARVVGPAPEPEVFAAAIDPRPAEGPGWEEADDEIEHEVDEPVDDDESDESDDVDDESDDVEFEFRGFAHAEYDAREARPRSSLELDSPALVQLRDKLRGFEILVERGDLDKAAVIARDIQAVLDDFDPLVYLPSLFARYLKLLNGTLDELEQRWAGEDTRAWRVLVQLYRADLDGFLDD